MKGQREKVSKRGAIVAGPLALVLIAGAAGLAWWGGVYDDLFGGADEEPSSALDVPPPEGLDLPKAQAPKPVLAPPGGPPVSKAALRDRVEPLLGDPDLGRHVGFTAYDLTHDRPLLTYGGGDTYVPASTLKVLTAVAALETIGGDEVFTTSTVLRPARQGDPPRVVLVGGGDPLLSGLSTRDAAELDPEPATLDQLAAETARALKDQGISRVSMAYDVSRYVGPSVGPTWEPGYVPGEVVPISPLLVDEGADSANPYEGTRDPAGVAVETFAAGLADRGIKVVGSPTGASGAGGRPLGAVDSPPLRDIVGYVLDMSYNAGAEVLLREVAVATDRPASFAGGVEAVREVLGDLGVPLRGVETYDGSGLSRDNQVTLDAMLAGLRLASDDRYPELRDAVSRLPVAGFTGTLAYRFVEDGAEAGLGLVRAKTGTLSNIHGLAGTVVDEDGIAVAFVALVDRVPLQDTLDARAILDEIAAAVASCGCSR